MSALLNMIRDAKAKHSRGNVKIIKPAEGKTKIRILPAGEGTKVIDDKPFWLDYGVHWAKPEMNAKPLGTVGCHYHTYESDCPACNAIAEAIKASDDDDEIKFFKELQARKGVLLNVVVRTGPNKSDNVQVMEVSSTTFAAICGVIEEYSEEGSALAPKGGIDLVIDRTGKGLETRYAVMPAARSEDVTAEQLQGRLDLAELVKNEYFTEAKSAKMLTSLAEITGTSPALAAPKTAGRLAGPKKTSAVIDEEVEVLEPAKKPAKKATVADDDEPPFEVDEKPAKSKGKVAAEIDDALDGLDLDDL